MENISDYDYLINIMNYVNLYHGLNLKVSNKDFDTMYRWWEKRIPLKVVKKAIDIAIESKKNKIKSFTGFNYRVRKEFELFLTFSLGDRKEEQTKANTESKIKQFLDNIPDIIRDLKPLFIQYYKDFNKEIKIKIENTLIERFENDNELNIKTKLFSNNLSKSIINDDLIKRFRVNYLINKLSIPEF